ncbi:hypothetical protein CASFOL_009056 [Castilleja foliolosa]|uniref:Uncharacterized protein n=1 Tax=Castilleja foliolosa TaxID=1961234 RepID=A0ABD3E0Q1_9LAMI
MQSRLITAAKLKRQLLSGGQRPFSVQRLGYATTSGRTADPAEHAVDQEEVSPTEAIQDEKRRHSPEHGPTTKDDNPFIPSKSPIQSEPKIGSAGVGPPINPIAQQKRRSSGDPWSEKETEIDFKKQQEEQQGDNVEYFKHHKASPLSEIEIADTRKPISRATDGTVQNETVGLEGSSGFIVWRPEQMDTAEDSLRRATEIYKSNAMRGDPDSPHGRVLRKLRGENW